ncbi:MAG: PEP-CTERM sorting domain-containing protein [Armatimonadetes bacterium]|nr:PEP-CTERM sorting domain-containing protein [Armatimonadota bacterium]
MGIGSLPWAEDNPSGVGFRGLDLGYWDSVVFCLKYYENGVDGWEAETGFSTSGHKGPFTPGQSKTYDNIYLWAKNKVLTTPNRVLFHTGTGDFDQIPVGYTAQLVLDYVPAECNWDGPMSFALDLGKSNNFTMPTIVTTNPLEGTRMHVIVTAPVPEPSSLAALGMGIAPLVMFGFRKRRW